MCTYTCVCIIVIQSLSPCSFPFSSNVSAWWYTVHRTWSCGTITCYKNERKKSTIADLNFTMSARGFFLIAGIAIMPRYGRIVRLIDTCIFRVGMLHFSNFIRGIESGTIKKFIEILHLWMLRGRFIATRYLPVYLAASPTSRTRHAIFGDRI